MTPTAATLTVAIIHSGDRPPSLRPRDWSGAWGSDIDCVAGAIKSFQNDPHFTMKRIHIRDIVDEKSLAGVHVLSSQKILETLPINPKML